jgi:hypothetical protein
MRGQLYRGRLGQAACGGPNGQRGGIVQRQPVGEHGHRELAQPDAECVTQPDELPEPESEPDHVSVSQPQSESV